MEANRRKLDEIAARQDAAVAYGFKAAAVEDNSR
jgi:hypothetical protein